jgi:hypothetical protein
MLLFKVIVAGTRDFNNYHLLKMKLDKILSNITDDIIIVSGKAKGADTLGEKYAKEKGYQIAEFPADWEKFGRSAGYKRNVQMAEYADACVCFWDGRSPGTKHMINIANQYKLQIRVVKY